MAFVNALWAFIVAIAVLVVIHELGHYLAARSSGVKVTRFSFGFGPVLWSRRGKHDQTEWAISAFPLGGYVKMVDEREGEVAAAELPRAFNRQSLAVRSWIVVAGPLANLLLAVAIYAALGMAGIDDFRPVVGQPAVASAAHQAGIEAGDEILALADQSVTSWSDFRWQVLQSVLDDKPLALKIRKRDGSERQVVIVIPESVASAPDRDTMSALGLRLMPLQYPAVVGSVLGESPAAAAGLLAGDRIAALNGKVVGDWAAFAMAIHAMPGQHVSLTIERNGESRVVELDVAAHSVEGAVIGRIGVGVALPENLVDDRRIEIRHGPVSAIGYGVGQVWQTSILTLRFMGRMLLGEVSWRNISGPVTIADYAGQTAQIGASAYLRFLALISISLGVLNLLPIPVLDGGHLLYYFAEFIYGRALSERVIEVSQQVGMTILALLMMFAFYNDFNRLFSG